jgi:type IV pilus assembly protein PilN
MKLTINLATKRYLNLRQLNAGLLVAFLLAGGLAVFKVSEIAHNAQELARLASLGKGTAEQGGVRVSDAQLKAQAARIQFANAAIERKTVNWLELLDRLEEVVPEGVTLNDIAPDRSKLVTIAGAARNFANLRTLLENMERSKNFTEVYLLSQKDTKVGLTQHGINFQISCKVALR